MKRLIRFAGFEAFCSSPGELDAVNQVKWNGMTKAPVSGPNKAKAGAGFFGVMV